LLIDNNGAGATESLTTAEFRARQSDFITEKPEQREVRVAVPTSFLAINLQLDHDRSSLVMSCRCLFEVSEKCFLTAQTSPAQFPVGLSCCFGVLLSQDRFGETCVSERYQKALPIAFTTGCLALFGES
jgi:hypothetical protein